MKRVKLLHEFDIRPGRRGKWLKVRVFATRRGMNQYRKWCGGRGGDAYAFYQGYTGDCSCEEPAHADEHKRCWGHVCFNRRDLGAGTVSHEMVHAALDHLTGGGWRAGSGVRIDATKNERLATMTGELVRLFWNGWFFEEKRRGRQKKA